MDVDRQKTLNDLLTFQDAENNRCADCRSLEVHWVSINLGAFLCLSCAGHHRNLGVQISKIQSLDLDDSVLRISDELKKKGNLKLNAKFEARLPSYWLRPRPSAGKGNIRYDESKTWDSIRRNFIVHKYMKRFFEEGKLVVNDPSCDRMPQAPYDTVCKVSSMFMGKTRWSNQWLIIVGAKVQLYSTENSLGAPQQLFDVRRLEVEVLDEPYMSLEIIRCDPFQSEKSITIAFADVDTLKKVVHKIRKAAMFYTHFPPKDINECKIDVSDLTIDPVTLRNAETYGWAYHIKGGMKSMSNLKKNRRFWALIGTKLYKFREDISQAEEPASPTGGIELEQAHVYLDQTRNNTIIIHTELIRFALMPEQGYLQKISKLLAQKVQQLQSPRFIDFAAKIPVEVRSQWSGARTEMVRADAEELDLEANTDYDKKSDEDKLVMSEIKHVPIRPAKRISPKRQPLGKIEKDNKMTIPYHGVEDKFVIIQNEDRESLLPPPPPRHSNDGDVPLPPPPPAIQPHKPKPKSSWGPDFKLQLEQVDSDPPPDDPVGCASPMLPKGSLRGLPKEAGKIMLPPPLLSPSVRGPPNSGPPLFKPPTIPTPGVLPPVFKPPPIPAVDGAEKFSSCTEPPLFNAHQKDNALRPKPPAFPPSQKNSMHNVGPPVFKRDEHRNMPSPRPPIFVPPQKNRSSVVGPPPVPSKVSSNILSNIDRSFNEIKQSPPPLPMKIKLGLT